MLLCQYHGGALHRISGRTSSGQLVQSTKEQGRIHSKTSLHFSGQGHENVVNVNDI